jgi:hypothetical protein
VFLPGRGILNKGQSALVAKSLVKLEGRKPEGLPENTPLSLHVHAARFLTKAG